MDCASPRCRALCWDHLLVFVLGYSLQINLIYFLRSGLLRAANDLFPATERSSLASGCENRRSHLSGTEMRTAGRLESSNVRAFYQFINLSLMLFFPLQILGVFLPFSLDLCPGK